MMKPEDTLPNSAADHRFFAVCTKLQTPNSKLHTPISTLQSPNPKPQTQTPLIRLARSDDAAPIGAIYEPAVAQRATSFELEPPDADEISRRIASCLEKL